MLPSVSDFILDEIERLFVDVMKYAIAEIDSKIEVLAIDHEKEPIIYTNSQDN